MSVPPFIQHRAMVHRELIARGEQGGPPRAPGQMEVVAGNRPEPGPPGLRTLKNAIVLSGEWLVVAEPNIYLDHYHQSPHPPHSAYVASIAPRQAVVVFEEAIAAPVAEAFMLGGCANYAHWLLDYLPLLSHLRSAPPGVKILVNSDLRPFQAQALALLGISAQRLVKLEYPRAYSIPRLHLPLVNSAAGYPEDVRLAPELLAWLRAAVLPAAAPPNRRGGTPTPRRVFISRKQDAPARRRLVNEDEIEAVAARWGFVPVVAQSLSFTDQVRLFAAAEAVCGPHGAGMANMAFAPADSLLIELLGPAFNAKYRADVFFHQIASMLGQRHRRVVGTTVDAHLLDPVFLNNERYRMDPCAVEATLRESLGPATT